MEEYLKFYSTSESVTGEFKDIIKFPEKTVVSMSSHEWSKMIGALTNIPFSNATLDIRDNEKTQFYAVDKSGKSIELFDFEDPLEFCCYRLHKPFAEQPILYLSIQAKYHDTFITYELSEKIS